MALDKLDFRLLRMFETIVEAGGFSAAQGELNLSLATISSHIASLETRLGVTLCRRGRSGFQLTPEGRVVYEEVRRLNGTLEQFDAKVRGLRDRLSGSLNIGLVDNTISDATAPLEAVIGEFTDAAPGVSLTIVTRPPQELLRDVIGRQLHLAVASFPRTTLGLVYTDLYFEVQRFYCGRGHPLFDVPDRQIDIGEVRKHNLVARSYWGARDMKVFAISAPKATVSDMESEARLILSGRYLGYLPEHYARQYVESGRIRSIRPDLFGYRAPFQAAHDPGESTNGVVRLFLKILTAHFKR